MTPATAERWLRLLLRTLGGLAVGGLAAAFMPTAWLAAAVAWLEPGVRVGVLVSYLARLLALFYFLLGMVLLVLAREPRRYRPLIRLVAGWCLLGQVALALFGTPFLWAEDAPRLLMASIVIDAALGTAAAMALLVLTAKLGDEAK